MPFTPFHLGAGAALKAIGGRHFSFMVFGGSQVLIDIEPLIGLVRGWDVLHGYTHTLAGALVIGTIDGIIGKPISGYVLNLLKIPHYPITWLASFVAAYSGTLSHILLDAMMHSDMNPWWPINNQNGMLDIISVGHLHLLCLGLGIIGSIGIAIQFKKHGRA